ncbi:MAG: hypothetical protein A2Z18_05910 [Armatimonadetes bacterium RBG_16_58_9]|nr:MAG: hypothetical protein A2Z18_05910 [Armatimonadetes bacterium RBG_16_58_9]
MKTSKLLLSAALMVLALSGCKEGRKARIADSAGQPVPHADVHVWMYALDPDRPQEHAEVLGNRYENGEKLSGWHFQANEDGRVVCKGLRTGRSVPDRMIDPIITKVPGPPPEKKEVYSIGDMIVVVYPSGDKVIMTKPGSVFSKRREDDPRGPMYSYRDEPGSWLGVTVVHPGYATRHFAFKPDSPEGDIGTIVMQRLSCAADDDAGPANSGSEAP